ncbi:hypothetical protein L6164_008475 [Bauhinia variegata]|uniref:Uncharacterized protein n=1 Tax=Bauhinia variegata TaxID=167791 RepID=A0ACB9PJN2_BAUVA|nr:hypothetical protein L6164_008475 [Bauhinia variegata]
MEECSSWNYNASEEVNKPMNEYINEENALGMEDPDPVSLNELMDCSSAFTTKEMGYEVPLHVVHPHWRKLSIQGMIKKTCIHSFKQLCICDAIEALWRRYNESDESGRITLTNKLLEVLAETSECPQMEKVSSSSPTTLPTTLHGFSTCTSLPRGSGCYSANNKLLGLLLQDFDGNDLDLEDGSVWGSSDDELDKASDLEREWQKRRGQFHMVIC